MTNVFVQFTRLENACLLTIRSEDGTVLGSPRFYNTAYNPEQLDAILAVLDSLGNSEAPDLEEKHKLRLLEITDGNSTNSYWDTERGTVIEDLRERVGTELYESLFYGYHATSFEQLHQL